MEYYSVFGSFCNEAQLQMHKEGQRPMMGSLYLPTTISCALPQLLWESLLAALVYLRRERGKPPAFDLSFLLLSQVAGAYNKGSILCQNERIDSIRKGGLWYIFLG